MEAAKNDQWYLNKDQFEKVRAGILELVKKVGASMNMSAESFKQFGQGYQPGQGQGQAQPQQRPAAPLVRPTEQYDRRQPQQQQQSSMLSGVTADLLARFKEGGLSPEILRNLQQSLGTQAFVTLLAQSGINFNSLANANGAQVENVPVVSVKLGPDARQARGQQNVVDLLSPSSSTREEGGFVKAIEVLLVKT